LFSLLPLFFFFPTFNPFFLPYLISSSSSSFSHLFPLLRFLRISCLVKMGAGERERGEGRKRRYREEEERDGGES
jgi:hypothetical protein